MDIALDKDKLAKAARRLRLRLRIFIFFCLILFLTIFLAKPFENSELAQNILGSIGIPAALAMIMFGISILFGIRSTLENMGKGTSAIFWQFCAVIIPFCIVIFPIIILNDADKYLKSKENSDLSHQYALAKATDAGTLNVNKICAILENRFLLPIIFAILTGCYYTPYPTKSEGGTPLGKLHGIAMILGLLVFFSAWIISLIQLTESKRKKIDVKKQTISTILVFCIYLFWFIMAANGFLLTA